MNRAGGAGGSTPAVHAGDAPRNGRRAPEAIEARAASVTVSTAGVRSAGGGSTPTAALHASAREVKVAVIPHAVARDLITRWHYTHSYPAATKIAFGVFLGERLIGALTLGCGPFYAHRLIAGARPGDGVTLSRFVLLPDRPPNTASRVLGVVLRELRRSTPLGYVLTYADPRQGHRGTIYAASGFLFSGLSEPQPELDLGDGIARNTRTVGSIWGSHSVPWLRAQGYRVTVVPVPPKRRFIALLRPELRQRLLVPIIPFKIDGGERDGDRRRAG